jgi:trigger factor
VAELADALDLGSSTARCRGSSPRFRTTFIIEENLNSNINDISASEKEVELTYTNDEIKNDLQKEIQKLSRNIQIPGFRKGKVPPHMIKKMYGDALEHEASEKISNTLFWKFAEENNLNPVGRPSLTDINYTPGADLNFKVKFEVVPAIEPTGYKDNKIEVPAFNVTDVEIEREIQYLKNNNRTLEPAGSTGDDRNYIIEIDVVRVDDTGEIFEGVKPENLKIDLTNERVQPEILENVKNKKTGETFTFTFTDERNIKSETGEESTVTEKFNYKAEIKGIEKIIFPEINEEFIKKVTKDKLSTEAEFREEIKNDIENYYNKQTEDFTRSRLIQQIVEKNDFVPPSTLVKNVLEDLIKHEEEHSKKEGWKLDKNEASNRLQKSAEAEVKWYLIKSAIKQKEDITLTDEDLNDLAANDAEKTGIAVDKLLSYYKSSNYKERLEDQKLFEFLKSNNEIVKTENFSGA